MRRHLPLGHLFRYHDDPEAFSHAEFRRVQRRRSAQPSLASSDDPESNSHHSSRIGPVKEERPQL
jgi:hypothetical protein